MREHAIGRSLLVSNWDIQTINVRVNNLMKEFSQPIFPGMMLCEAPGRACGYMRLQVLTRHKAYSCKE